MNTSKQMTPIITKLMDMYGNDMTQTAAALGITTTQLYYWMAHGVPFLKALHVEGVTKKAIKAEDILLETLAIKRKTVAIKRKKK